MDEEPQYAKILSAADHGTIWILNYQIEDNGNGCAYFDHRPFAHFYRGATGRSFHDDYNFGAGREYVSDQLKDKQIEVEGEFPEQIVRLLDKKE